MIARELLRRTRTTIVFVIALFIGLAFCSQVAAQQVGRKSISFVPVVAVTSDSLRVPYDLKISFMEQQKSVLESMQRWDINPLPESIIRNFVNRMESRPARMADLKSALAETLISRIQEILEQNVIKRAEQYIDEADRRKFISEKARELSLTESDLRLVMNSAFIAVPYINFNSQESTKEKVSVEIVAGIAWYQVVTGETGKLTVEHLSDVGGYQNTSEKFKQKVCDYGIVNCRQVTLSFSKARSNAIEQALVNVTPYVVAQTKALEPFNLKSSIMAVSGRRIEFNLGVGQDIGLDDMYYLTEYRLNDEGKPTPKTVGFARVSRVGDFKRGKASYARVVRSQAVISPGMTLRELPRFGLGMDMGFGLRVLKFSPGKIKYAGREYYLLPHSGDVFLPTFNLGLRQNLVKRTGISQMFLNVDFCGTIHKFGDGRALEGQHKVGIDIVVGATATLSKKFWVGAVALEFEGGGGALLWQNFTNFDDSAEVNVARLEYRQIAIGGVAGISLELAKTVGKSYGISARYWFGVPMDDWKLEIRRPNEEDGSTVEPSNADRPSIELTGLEIRAYISYSM